MMASCSSSVGPNWLELPRDLTANILKRLGVIEIVKSACLVCPLWWNICKDPLMWRTVDLSNHRTSPYDHLVKICRYAVGRSCGLLEDINIEYFGTNDLLKYIADCTRSLRCLRLAKCWEISNQGLIEVAKKLPWLEELDISMCRLSKDSLEVIGKCCPLLKSLKFSGVFSIIFQGDDEAFAIAKSMPELRHLNIVGRRLTNVGLLAILDGCPHLESLDLRACLYLDLRGCLGKRCHEQIKDLLLPAHCVDDSCDDDDGDGDSCFDSPIEGSNLPNSTGFVNLKALCSRLAKEAKRESTAMG